MALRHVNLCVSRRQISEDSEMVGQIPVSMNVANDPEGLHYKIVAQCDVVDCPAALVSESRCGYGYSRRYGCSKRQSKVGGGGAGSHQPLVEVSHQNQMVGRHPFKDFCEAL